MRGSCDVSGVCVNMTWGSTCRQPGFAAMRTRVTIEQRGGGDAAVVRCSSCRGAREANAAACAHCGRISRCTIGLNTVCPGCFCRVSDRAAFCHHCGLLLLAESSFAIESSLACPLSADASPGQPSPGEVSAMECGRWCGSSGWSPHVSVAHDASRQASGAKRSPT